ncbi:MAG TPA: hypothetical protein DDW65_02470 [Firmicutes bacterium]|nr:hypothetical protein [Bacillota bacterium]
MRTKLPSIVILMIMVVMFSLFSLPKVNADGVTPVPGNIYTIAGGDSLKQGQAITISQCPMALAIYGSFVYVADSQYDVIRRIDLNTGNEVVVAGSGIRGYSGDNGQGTDAKLGLSITYAGNILAIDGRGNLYIADGMNSCIRKVDSNGNITTIAGNGTSGYSGDNGPAINAKLEFPTGVALDNVGNLYIADYGNNVIRKVDANGIITTVAGNGTQGFSGDNGPAINAELNNPTSVALDSNNNLYITDCSNNRIRKVDSNGIMTTIAGKETFGYSGDGQTATSAGLNLPTGITIDSFNNLYIADNSNCRIRKIDIAGTITTVAGIGVGYYSGDNGPAINAAINFPTGVVTDPNGNLYIADFDNHRIRKVDGNGNITTIAGTGMSYFGDNGPATSTAFYQPSGVIIDGVGNIYIADSGNYVIRKIDNNGIVTTIAGNGFQGYYGDNGPATNARLNFSSGLAIDKFGNLYIADTFNNVVRKVDTNGNITTVAGNGTEGYSGDNGLATSVKLDYPSGVAVDNAGNLYIADSRNDVIRKVDINGIITTVVGKGRIPGYSGDNGLATSAELDYPTILALDNDGNLYITDYSNSAIRKVDTNGIITTVAGGRNFLGYSGDGGIATNAFFNCIGSVEVDKAGNIYIADSGNHVIRKVDQKGIITTIAGNGASGYSGDGSAAITSQFSWPESVAVDSTGNLYIADTYNNRIREIVAPYPVTYNGNGNTGGSIPRDCNNYQQLDTVTVLSNINNLVKTGYVFGGWNTEPNGSGTSYAPGTTFTMGAFNVSLYAQWVSPPAIISIDRLNPIGSLTNLTSVTFRVTFNENVYNVDTSDFILTSTGTVTGTIASVSASSGATINVTVNSITGDGTLRLDLDNNCSITDLYDNPINGGFNNGNVYTIDNTALSVNITRSNPCWQLTNLTSVTYFVQFNKSVSGVDVNDFTLTTTGGTTGTISSVTQIASGWFNVTISSISGEGTLRLDLKDGEKGIVDSSGNSMTSSFTNGDIYTIDNTPPKVISISRLSPVDALTNATSVTYRVTFNEHVNNVNSGNFTLSRTGNAWGIVRTIHANNGMVFDVTIDSITGEGTLRLDLSDNVTQIKDDAGNSIDGVFTSGETYTVDTTPPHVTSIMYLGSSSSGICSSSIIYRVKFSENVNNVDINDFVLTPTGTVTGNIASVSSGSGNIIDVTVSPISGDGTLRLDLKNSGTGITDNIGNAINDGYTSGFTYTVDNTKPSVVSIKRNLPNTQETNFSNVTYLVTFSETVTGVDINDFILNVNGAGNCKINYVSMSGNGEIAYVSVTTAGDNTTVRLDLKDSDTGITDYAGNPIDGGYVSGENYVIDNVAPTVISINRLSPSQPVTNWTSVRYRVTFSESVSGVDIGDFFLTSTGTATGIISSLTAIDDNIYDVTISSIKGSGTLHLALRSYSNIKDIKGNVTNQGFNSGETYTFETTAPKVISITRLNPLGPKTNSTTITYRINFNENVNGIDLSDFSLIKTGTATGSIASVSASSGTTIDLIVNAVDGNGTLRLDLKSTGSGIKDDAGNIIVAGFTNGETYSIENIVAIPTFSPDGGTSSSIQAVTISCATEGATIRYTTNGSEPTTSSPIINSGSTVQIDKTMTLKAKAWKNSWVTSATKSSIYTINIVATPTFNVAGGTYTTAQKVSISCATAGATIHYTTNGDEPSESSPTITSGSFITIANTTILKAKAFKTNWGTSDLKSVTYTIAVTTPTFSLAAGTYTTAQKVTISCATLGASIYYTTDGSTPTVSSQPYSASLDLNLNTVTNLQAIAVKDGLRNSDIKSVTYTITGTVAIPTFSPDGGTSSSIQAVTISCATEGGTIRYTTNGSEPTTSSPVINSGSTVQIDKTMTLKAKAWKNSWVTSATKSSIYTINIVATPTFNVAGGTYTTAKKVSINCATAGATIRYTKDGNEPSESSPTITFGSFITIANTTILKAKAFKAGWGNSDPMVATYIIAVATPTFNLAAGTYTSTQKVSISCATLGTSIYYTTDGSTPTTASQSYNASTPVVLDLNTITTLKAIAVKDGLQDSDIKNITYTITGTVATPTFSPEGGTFSSVQTVTINCATEGAIIRYTTNGSEPTTSSPVINSGSTVLVNKTMTLKAKAWKNLWVTSATKSAAYTINIVATPKFNLAGGTYITATKVIVSCATAGATIHYTTNGDEPSDSSPTIISGSFITIANTTILKAKAFKAGWGNSDSTSAEYVIGIVQTPFFYPSSMTFRGFQEVTIGCGNPEAKIYYTTDGSTPTENSILYTGIISVDKTTTIKARAFFKDMAPSIMASATFTLL